MHPLKNDPLARAKRMVLFWLWITAALAVYIIATTAYSGFTTGVTIAGMVGLFTAVAGLAAIKKYERLERRDTGAQ